MSIPDNSTSGCKRKYNYDGTDDISESEPSESGSDCSSEDDEGDDDSEGEGGGDIREVPRRLFDLGWKLLAEGEKEKLIKAKSAFEKAIFILLQTDEDLQQLGNKIAKRKNKSDGKVPPGSALVQRSVTDGRFLMCQCKVAISRIYVSFINERPAQYTDDALSLLGDAVLWYPRSVEAHVLTAQLMKYNTCNSYAELEFIENCYKKAANMVLDTPLGNGGNSSATNTSPMSQLQVLSGSTTDSNDPSSSDDMSAADLAASLDMFLLIREKEQCRAAKQQLSLIYLQYYNSINGGKHSKSRLAEASEMLQHCGFTHRLSDSVFSYPLPNSSASELVTTTPGLSKDNNDRAAMKNIACGFDNVLPEIMLAHLRQVFRPEAPYWREHDYDAYVGNHSKTVGYFSYLYPLRERAASNSIEQIIDCVYKQVLAELPAVAECNVAEWWVHSRPFSNGHQFHYDSDETNTSNGCKPQHPIVTSVIYCTEPLQESDGGECPAMGGPTLVTNQTLACNLSKLNGGSGDGGDDGNARLLADKGWLCYPRYNRMVTFNAKYLHGVVPGRNFEYQGKQSSSSAPGPLNNSSSSSSSCSSSSGSSSMNSKNGQKSSRRLTFMIGFWKNICAVDRGVDNAGPGQPFPGADSKFTWPQEMKPSENFPNTPADCEGPECTTEYVTPVSVSPIWQPVAGLSSSSSDGAATAPCTGAGGSAIPSYDKCFQGF